MHELLVCELVRFFSLDYVVGDCKKFLYENLMGCVNVTTLDQVFVGFLIEIPVVHVKLSTTVACGDFLLD